MSQLNVVIIPGSLRKDSYNKLLARTVKSLAPKNMEIEILDISHVPFMNEDLEINNVPPQEVLSLKNKVREADAVIFVTPEYNNMVPGVLKNTIEWLSRQYDNVLLDKPVAMMGASNGYYGTERAQQQLMLLCTILKMKVSSALRLTLPKAQDKFDEFGELNDEEIKDRIIDLLEKFAKSLK